MDLTVDEDHDAPRKNSVFRVYWQNRLVPETVVEKLGFFPETTTLVQCDALQVYRRTKYCVSYHAVSLLLSSSYVVGVEDGTYRIIV